MSKKIKVLLVDDNKDVLYTVKQSLEQLDPAYEVIEASSGQECLDKVDSKPDIILLDIMMPGMDGYGVAEQLQGNPDTKNIPIIFLTAKSDKLSKERGSILARDYIEKPFDPKKLDKIIKKNIR